MQLKSAVRIGKTIDHAQQYISQEDESSQQGSQIEEEPEHAVSPQQSPQKTNQSRKKKESLPESLIPSQISVRTRRQQAIAEQDTSKQKTPKDKIISISAIIGSGNENKTQIEIKKGNQNTTEISHKNGKKGEIIQAKKKVESQVKKAQPKGTDLNTQDDTETNLKKRKIEFSIPLNKKKESNDSFQQKKEDSISSKQIKEDPLPSPPLPPSKFKKDFIKAEKECQEQNQIDSQKIDKNSNQTPLRQIFSYHQQNFTEKKGTPKQGSSEKKQLTISEMEAMSKLLSIQADGLKMKQQQMLNSFNQNASRICGGISRSSQFGTVNGQLPLKKFKVNGDQCLGKQQIVQKNINTLINQLPNYDSIKADEELDNYFIDDQRDQVSNFSLGIRGGQSVSYRSITPSNKDPTIYPYSQYQSANNNQQQLLKQNITPTSKAGKVITPTLQSQQYSEYGGNLTPRMAPSPGKVTPISNKGVSQPQQIQKNYIHDIENEIQSRIETIKNEIGPLLACLNSDLISGGHQQNQEPLQQEINNSEDQLLNRRIYQDMRDRRLHTIEQIPRPSPNISYQQNRGRSSAPLIVPTRMQYEQEQMNAYNTNIRNITPARSHSSIRLQNENIQEHKQNGRNYDARAGDWICGNCKNLNFAYRDVCNRCRQEQDENAFMIHPQITSEALDLIHELNHGIKKAPIRTIDDVKRTFSDMLSNKENLKSFSNMMNPQMQHDSTNQKQSVKQSTYGQNRRQHLSYKQLQDMGFESAPSYMFQNGQIAYSQNNNSDILQQNIPKQMLIPTSQQPSQNKKEISCNEIIGHKIVFIDNSRATPIVENNQVDSMNDQCNQDNQNDQDFNICQETQQFLITRKKMAIDPRIQMR